MRRILIPAAIAALALAGCGSDDNGSSGGGYGAPATTETGGAVKPTTTPASEAPPANAATKAVDVKISNFKFAPASVAVTAGGTITWTNEDSAQHTATDDKSTPPFDTGTLDQGDSKKVTFKKAGTYPYICTFHPFMKGTVVVE
jgi:plastocyanin